ncbi:hypothetical protein [Streptomyces varsoviensis]|uniref:Uncharacterized protein n=1 Tax=Streptomyces varsoviensis TaxID=67373 RepID=A0ABR5IVL1_9ACTN|nr:hypothetical protein [Streptomyces varsoviensis]KOG85193.1 hypothetical protein ADK38_38020 [Streptomyces varsoviensis]
MAQDGYSISIEMDDATTNRLREGGFRLYGFRGVRSSSSNGRPLVWFSSLGYMTATEISWAPQLKAFTSHSQIIPDGRVTASNSYNIELGQTLEVKSITGTGTVSPDGLQGAVSVYNETSTEFTTGISQRSDVGDTSSFNPLCAFPLFGGNINVFTPVEKVLLFFASDSINTGTVIERAFAPGLLIDVTGVGHRSVQYHINTGWSPSEIWARKISARDNIVPLLVESPNELAHDAERLSKK